MSIFTLCQMWAGNPSSRLLSPATFASRSTLCVAASQPAPTSHSRPQVMYPLPALPQHSHNRKQPIMPNITATISHKFEQVMVQGPIVFTVFRVFGQLINNGNNK